MPNKHGLQPWRDPRWIEYRLRIYKALTLASLRRQQFANFDVLLECCEESRPFMEPHLDELEFLGVNVVFDGGREFFANVPQHIRRFQLIRIDSDDIYAPQALHAARAGFTRRKAIQFVGGWWWHTRRGDVRRWLASSPPFYGVSCVRSRVTTCNSFFAGRVARRGHSIFRAIYRPVILPGAFCVCAHDKNNLGGHGYGRHKIPPAAVLPRFGISYMQWLDYRKGKI